MFSYLEFRRACVLSRSGGGMSIEQSSFSASLFGAELVMTEVLTSLNPVIFIQRIR
jgi:hypothetical protein